MLNRQKISLTVIEQFIESAGWSDSWILLSPAVDFVAAAAIGFAVVLTPGIECSPVKLGPAAGAGFVGGFGTIGFLPDFGTQKNKVYFI